MVTFPDEVTLSGHQKWLTETPEAQYFLINSPSTSDLQQDSANKSLVKDTFPAPKIFKGKKKVI